MFHLDPNERADALTDWLKLTNMMTNTSRILIGVTVCKMLLKCIWSIM